MGGVGSLVLDKLFGLGRATPAEGAWVNGGSPTAGFLGNAPTGPFASSFNSIAGAAWADWLFRAALLGVGTALILGIGVRIAAISGGLLLTSAGRTLGLGRTWEQLPLVNRISILK